MNRRIDRLITWSLILIFPILFLLLIVFVLFRGAGGWRWRRWGFTLIFWNNRHWDGHHWIWFLRIITCGTFWVIRSRWWGRYVSRFLFLSFIFSIIKINRFSWELGLFKWWFYICWNFLICVFTFCFNLFLFILFLCCHHRQTDDWSALATSIVC